MENQGTPYEVIAAPYTAWWAPYGTAFPDLSADPAATWKLIGISGDKSQFEAGVKIKHDQTVKKIFAAGATGPVKAVRDQEDLEISLEVMDMTLETYAQALNQNPVNAVAAGAGVAAQKNLPLLQGIPMAEIALLCRGVGPYGAALPMQFEVPRCVQTGKPTPVFAKGKPAGLAFVFTALTDLNAPSTQASFGYVRAQTA